MKKFNIKVFRRLFSHIVCNAKNVEILNLPFAKIIDLKFKYRFQQYCLFM